MRSLSGRLALVTGSARGLGKKTALALAELGCDVAVNYVRSASEAESLVKRIESLGVRAAAFPADVSRPDQLRGMMEQVERTFGTGVDILVNNAGPFVRERKLYTEYAWEDIDALVRGNLLGAMELDWLVLSGMQERRWGRIIHFGFAHASEARGWPHRAAYAAAKVALVSLTKTLAAEMAAFGITVNMVCPGDVRGDHKEQNIDEVLHLRDDETPRGRPGSGEDVARVVAFLCDPASDFVTGNIINVNGGMDPIRSLPLR
jgi:Dehydrogenases with different specificities (related to short-chain alcohol dehydrogenases)